MQKFWLFRRKTEKLRHKFITIGDFRADYLAPIRIRLVERYFENRGKK